MLVSHHLCPYVQRALIVAAENQVVLEKRYIDLAAKPDWFLALSPTGKTPLLLVTDPAGARHALFESAAISEYLDETAGPRLMPADPIARARHRAWVEYASNVLADVAGLYSAPDEAAFSRKRAALEGRFQTIASAIAGPWFDGEAFSLVDAAFAPVFRYLDAFERLAELDLAPGLPKLAAWRQALAARASVATAVGPDYPQRLETFLRARNSHLSQRIERADSTSLADT